MHQRSTSPPPLKRARRAPSPPSSSSTPKNGHPPPTSSHHAPNTSSTSTTLPPLSLSILGVEPLDEFIKEIADFVHHMIVTAAGAFGGHVEVEAKVGVLRERGGGGRIGLPVLVETILAPDGMDLRFESNMSVHQHQHYNTLLNELKLQPTHAGSPLSYKHLHLIDNFFPSDPSSSNDKGKIRVTRDEKTNVVLECMRKIRLGDLNIYSPKQAADWRVSVNLEVPMAHPIGTPTHTRRKDRLSYAHEEFSIDLTQVTSSTAPNAPTQILHELEIEISRSELLLATAMKRNDPNVSEHEASAFDELIRAFVNNARILVRNSSEGWQ